MSPVVRILNPHYYTPRSAFVRGATVKGGTMPKKKKATEEETIFNPAQAARDDRLHEKIRELERENVKLQSSLNRVADLASASEGDEEEDPDELVTKLNQILDIVDPEAADEDHEEDEEN